MASNNTLKLMAVKLGLSEEDKVINKAAEYIRLLNTKSTAGSNMTDTSKVVICLDLAAAIFNTDLDSKTAVKFSGLKGPSYGNCKKIVENLLAIKNNKLSVSSLCLTLQCSGVQTLAQKILEEYQKCSKTDIDLNLPQYVCMAVYQACRVNKIKVSKTKIIDKSRLKPSQWAKLDADWTKFVAEKFTTVKNKGKDVKTSKECATEQDMEIDVLPEMKEKSSEPVEEPYEDWKRRILDEAYKEFKELEKKENDIIKKGAMSPRRSPRKTPQKFSPYKCQKNDKKFTGIRLLFPNNL